MQLDGKKFIHDLIDEAADHGGIDPLALLSVILSSLTKQMGDGDARATIVGVAPTGLTRGQKAARTRKRNAAKKANSGAGEGTSPASA